MENRLQITITGNGVIAPRATPGSPTNLLRRAALGKERTAPKRKFGSGDMNACWVFRRWPGK